MPVLLCLALLFSQALGFQHGFDHSKLLSHLELAEQTIDQNSNEYFKDLGSKKNQSHSCVAVDSLCFAFFALAKQFEFVLLTHLIEARQLLAEHLYSKKQYFLYLSRAPPNLS